MQDSTHTQDASKAEKSEQAKPYRSARFMVPDHCVLETSNLPADISLTEPNLIHRAQNVLRLKAGHVITLINTHQHISVDATINTLTSNELHVSIQKVNPSTDNHLPRIILLAGLIKGSKWDWLIEKATELGVQTIIPIQSDHAVVQISAKDSVKKQAKWQQLAYTTVEQCDGRFIPNITTPMSISHAIQHVESLKSAHTQNNLNNVCKKFILMENGDTRSSLMDQLSSPSHSTLPKTPQLDLPDTIIIATGPEGGWSKRECDLMLQQGFTNTQLGLRVLKAETASIAAISVIVGLYDKKANTPTEEAKQ